MWKSIHIQAANAADIQQANARNTYGIKRLKSFYFKLCMYILKSWLHAEGLTIKL